MTHPFSLAFLTTHDAPPDQAVRIAAETGYDTVGLRFLPAAPASEPPFAIMTDREVQDSVAAALSETGIALGDIEIVRLGPDTDPTDFIDFLALGARFGARHVLVAGDDSELQRLAQTFGRFCDLAADHGLTADLEFMPWTGVKTLAQAQEVVERADRSNGGVLVDALHWHRSGGTTADIAALPPELIHYAQLCDGPVPYDPSDAGMIAIARGARLLPGDGGIDLAGMVRALPSDCPLSLEIPRLEAAKTLTPKLRAGEALAAAQQLMGLAAPA